MSQELERLKKEVDNLKKQKIIMQAKLKQKEDKITDLNKRVRELQIESKEAGPSKNLEGKVNELEDELQRSKKINQSLRGEANRLTRELEETKKALKSAQKLAVNPKIEPVAVSGPSTEPEVSSEELEYLQAQLVRKDEIISRLNEQLQLVSPQALSQAGTSYMKTRKLNSKIRELKGQVELAKRSEASMKERLLEMQRRLASRDDDLKW